LPRATRLSADGKWAYVLDFDQQTIWALDTADNSVVGTLDVGGHPEAMALGPVAIPLCHRLSGWHCLRHPNGAAEAQGGGKVMHLALRFFAASTCWPRSGCRSLLCWLIRPRYIAIGDW